MAYVAVSAEAVSRLIGPQGVKALYSCSQLIRVLTIDRSPQNTVKYLHPKFTRRLTMKKVTFLATMSAISAPAMADPSPMGLPDFSIKKSCSLFARHHGLWLSVRI
jgi:hypothetical protein